MRKTNNLPLMGRTVLVAVMVLVGLGVFAGQARAQVDLQDYMGWWDRWTGESGCTAMINVVNILEINFYDATTRTRGGTTHVAATKPADRGRWCVPWAGLSTASSSNDAKNLKDAVTMGKAGGTTATDAITKKASDNIFNVQGYWTSIGAGTSNVNTRRLVLGLAPDAPDPGADYGMLPRMTADAVDMAYMALMPGGMMPTDDGDEEEAPALPLVGIGLLGLLLAGRGAWLRRRA